MFVYACGLGSSLDDLKANAGKDAGLETGQGGALGGDSGGGKGGFDASGGSSASGGDSASEASSGAGGDATSDAKDPCASMANCQSCCTSTHQQGAKVQLDAIVTCLCSDAGFCATSCENYCTSGIMDLSCNNCAGTTEVQKCMQDKCQVSPECVIYVACNGDCPK